MMDVGNEAGRGAAPRSPLCPTAGKGAVRRSQPGRPEQPTGFRARRGPDRALTAAPGRAQPGPVAEEAPRGCPAPFLFFLPPPPAPHSEAGGRRRRRRRWQRRAAKPGTREVRLRATAQPPGCRAGRGVVGGALSTRREAGNELRKQSWERSCGASGGGGGAGAVRGGPALPPRAASASSGVGAAWGRVAGRDGWSPFLVSCTHRAPSLLALRRAICRAFLPGCSLWGCTIAKRGDGVSGEALGIHVVGLQPSPGCVLVLFVPCGVLHSSEDPHSTVLVGVLSPCIKPRRGICTCYGWAHFA